MSIDLHPGDGLVDDNRVTADPLVGLTTSDRARPALHAGRTVTYGELDELVGARAALLRRHDSLHPVAPGRDLASVVELLAAWRAGRAVLMLPPGEAAQRLTDAWPPEGPEGRGYDLHPDLALLMSTSGSTGAPKLVRLSHINLASNAAAIAEYLDLSPDDVALSTLPLHYCYGLSVLTSHLRARASVVLSERSVTDPALWRLAARHGVTSFAGVPHTFELLERSGRCDDLPSTLRYVTQAGGRMPADAVSRWARWGRSAGVDLVVMYGQTEATARMAWLPPALVERCPDAVGVPIPGGELHVEPVPGLDADLPAGTGELVYTGANVMLGYATEPEDLARGADLTRLRTGDLGLRDEDGVFRVVGRLARFAKVYGLRVDLDSTETALRDAGIEGRVLDDDGRLAVFVTSPDHAEPAGDLVSEETGLPAHTVAGHVVPELPLNLHGKRDDAPLRRLLRGDPSGPRPVEEVPLTERLRSTYASILGRPDATPDDSFVSLRGDSLSFVEANVRLVELLGDVPADWPRRTVRELAGTHTADHGAQSRQAPTGALAAWRRWPRVDSSLLLRAVAIVLVVGSHTDVWMVPGGAHTLLALVGFSLVRFHLGAGSGDPPGARGARVAGLLLKVLVPSVLVMGTVAAVRGTYDLTTVVGLNNLLGADEWTDQWRMWFVEAITWGLLAVALLLRLPSVDRLERRAPYLVPLLLLGVTLAARWAWIGWEAGNPQRYSLPFVWSFLLLGWLAARSSTTRLRIATSGAAALTAIGFFGDPVREAVVLAAVLVLTWVPQVRLPRRAVAPLGVLAASSLWVYLVHWEVYPPVEEVSEPLALLVSFAVGIAAWWAWTGLTRRSRTLRWAG